MLQDASVVVQKAFKYRFFPTDEQAAQLAKTFGCARYVYNQALEYRTIAWQQDKKSISYHATAAKLTQWKKEPESRSGKYSANWTPSRHGTGGPSCLWIGSFRRRNCVRRVAIC